MSKGNGSNIKFPGHNATTAIHNSHNNNSGGGASTSFANSQPEERSSGSTAAAVKRQPTNPNFGPTALLQTKPRLLSNTGLPPRYQPPPPVSGILKQQQHQRNLGQPDREGVDAIIQSSEVDELYLATTTNNPFSRIVPPKFQAREGRGHQLEQQSHEEGGHRSDVQVQIHPPPRAPTNKSVPTAASLGKSEDEFDFLRRKDMLKFVRKSESGQPSPSSSASGGSGRMAVDRDQRHLQVGRHFCFQLWI